jgi:phosphopantothenoylcysteine decarboxylase/phosphopantothenate--cysteine ligase
VEIKGGKISTREGTLMAELLPTPKVISELRTWFPQARLVGWKFEVEGTREEVLRLAEKQMSECQTDACVVNGAAYGEGFGLVGKDREVLHLPERSVLFEALEKLVKGKI